MNLFHTKCLLINIKVVYLIPTIRTPILKLNYESVYYFILTIITIPV